jgi:GNAT superfamily N-acetyltransferase
VLIRDAQPGEEYAVADVHVRAWKRAYRGLLPAAYLNELHPRDRVSGYRFGDSGTGAPHTLLAFDRTALVGFCTFGASRDEDAPAAGELFALYVDPDRWRTGAGRALLLASRERLHALGYREAVLWVLRGNQPAERFYESDGWRRDGSSRWEDPWGVRSQVFRFRRELP